MGIRYRLVLLILFFLGVVGCGHSVRLHGLAEFTETLVLPRFRHAPTQTLNRLGEPAENYEVSAADILEFSSKSGEMVTLSVGRSKAPCAVQGLVEGNGLAKVLLAPRISAAMLGVVPVLDIQVGSVASQSKALCNEGTGVRPIGSSTPWSKVREVLRGEGYKVKLIPRQVRRAMPGDNVRMTVSYQFAMDPYTGPQPFQIFQTTSRVDASGYLYLPGLTSPEAATLPLTKSIQYFVRQNSVPPAFQVAVWQTGFDFIDQAGLDEIENCLSIFVRGVGEFASQTLKSRCQMFGIDNSIYGGSDNDNQKIVFKLELDQSWTLVMPDGSHLEIPYIPSQTVYNGLREVLRASRGVELSEYDSYFITVVPSPVFVSNERAPFFAQIEERSVMDDVLIAPGDTIHLTYTEPESTDSEDSNGSP